MNVINKLKSKKNQHAPSQQPLVEQTEKKEQLISSYESQSLSNQPTSKHVEIRGNSNYSEISSRIEEDADEINLSEYEMKKERKKQLLNRTDNSGSFEEQLKQRHYSLEVKKSFNIADICVFEGELVLKANNQTLSRKKVKMTCSSDAIQFAQNIGRILLTKVTMFNEGQGIFIGENILRIFEKKYNKK